MKPSPLEILDDKIVVVATPKQYEEILRVTGSIRYLILYDK